MASSQDNPWTEDRVAVLKTMWLQGHSAAQISRFFDCGITRNAVIGKIQRLRLSGRATKQSERQGPRIGPKVQRPAKAQDGPPKNPAPSLDWTDTLAAQMRDGKLVCVLALEPGDCKWPYDGGEAHFCARPASVGSYCEHHSRKAYRSEAPNDLEARYAKAAA